MKSYTDTTLTPEERAELLLAELSLDEKMSQVICCMPMEVNPSSEYWEQFPNGAGNVSCLVSRQFKTASETAEFQHSVQTAIMKRTEHHIPAIFHMEGLCGALIQGAASFPSGIGRASSLTKRKSPTTGTFCNTAAKRALRPS
jgi:beta-glucosidase